MPNKWDVLEVTIIVILQKSATSYIHGGQITDKVKKRVSFVSCKLIVLFKEKMCNSLREKIGFLLYNQY